MQVKGAAAPTAKAPVRECGVKDQVSWMGRLYLNLQEPRRTGPTMRSSHATPRPTTRTRVAALAATAALLALPACSVGPINLDVEALLGGGASVAEAQAARRQARTSSLAAGETLTQGTLTVGLLTSETAPLLLSGSDDASQGLDVDAAYALADQLGVDCTFVSVADLASAYATCDVVMGAQAGDDAGSAVAGSYAEDAMALFGRAEAGTKATASGLSGKKVGVQAGSVSQRALSQTNLQVEQQNFTNLNEAFEALDAGTIDYVLCGAYPGGYLAAVYDGISCVGTLGAPSYIGVAVKAENSALFAKVLDAMDEISSNGVIDVVRGKWVGKMSRLDASSVIDGVAEAEPDAPATE